MESEAWLETLLPKQFIQRVLGKLPNRPFEQRLRWDLFKRPDYAYGVYQAALQARALGIPRICAIEFGVAGGNGLLALEDVADQVTKHVGVGVDTYGFDTGTGMPAPVDYRDMPYLWQPGFFRMDVDLLMQRLRQSVLVLGDFMETVPKFISGYGPAPIGFLSFDCDYYSSAIAAFQLFGEDHRFFLPRVLCYFDDMIGGDWELHSPYTGELLAITEFNQRHTAMKIARINGLAQKRKVPAWWHELMFVHHRFDHPLYNHHIFPEKDWQMKLEPVRSC
jgi:NADH:ubiquinone oxidoreductase subunit